MVRIRVSPLSPVASHSEEVVAEGFPERTDPAALVVGLTGVGLGEEGTLRVAETRTASAPSPARTREMPRAKAGPRGHRRRPEQPLGLTITLNDDILTRRRGWSLVETTPVGAEFQPFEHWRGAGGCSGRRST